MFVMVILMKLPSADYYHQKLNDPFLLHPLGGETLLDFLPTLERNPRQAWLGIGLEGWGVGPEG
jgi:hypothetical protein